MDRPSINDHKKAGSEEIDWASYYAADRLYVEHQVATGEKCMKCRQWLFGSRGFAQFCSDCSRLVTSKEDASSDHFIRCPACRATWKHFDEGSGIRPEEGECDVICPTCDHKFEVSVTVTYTVRSPALIVEPDPPEEPEEPEADQ